MTEGSSPRFRAALGAGGFKGATQPAARLGDPPSDETGTPARPRNEARGGLAPRCAGTRIGQIREAFQQTATQFGQSVGVQGSMVSKWEAGMARVPASALACAEKAHAKLLAEREAAAKRLPAEILMPQEFPYQEPMIGTDFQASVPKTSGSSK